MRATPATSHPPAPEQSARPSSPAQKPVHTSKADEHSAPDEHPFLRAARIGDTVTVERLLASKKRYLKELALGGLSALHLAAENGHRDMVAVLIKHGAEINAVDEVHSLPLHAAAERGHMSVAQLLLASDAQNVKGETPLYLATGAGLSDMAELLLAKGAYADSTALIGDAPLHVASKRGHSLVVRALLKYGANAAVKSGTIGWTALASRLGHTDVARLLLDDQVGASTIEVASEEAATPLYVACEYGQTAVVRLLLSRGADFEVPMSSGATALVIAAQKGYREIVHSLLQYGARTDAKGDRSMNALHLAAIGGNPNAPTGAYTEIIALLCAAGADLDARDMPRKTTALHYVVHKRLASSISLLLRYGADFTIRDIEGQTALAIAITKDLGALFDGVRRVSVLVTPVAQPDLVATTVQMNTVSTLAELRTRVESVFRNFRVLWIATDAGTKASFPENEAMENALAELGSLCGEVLITSVRVALRPGSRRKEL